MLVCSSISFSWFFSKMFQKVSIFFSRFWLCPNPEFCIKRFLRKSVLIVWMQPLLRIIGQLLFHLRIHFGFYVDKYSSQDFRICRFDLLAGQPESVPREKNWNFLKCFHKKSWKTCATTYQRDLRVIKHQGLRKWYRHVRTSITFAHSYRVTFYTFKTLAWLKFKLSLKYVRGATIFSKWSFFLRYSTFSKLIKDTLKIDDICR